MRKVGVPRGGYNPKTAAGTEMKPKPPVLSDAAATSADTQKQITRPPQPFNANSVVQQKVGSKAPGGISTLEPRIRSGLQRMTVGARALPDGGAIGQNKMPNQSGQIGGRKGFPPPRRRVGAYPAGYKSKRNASFYGE